MSLLVNLFVISIGFLDIFMNSMDLFIIQWVCGFTYECSEFMDIFMNSMDFGYINEFNGFVDIPMNVAYK